MTGAASRRLLGALLVCAAADCKRAESPPPPVAPDPAAPAGRPASPATPARAETSASRGTPAPIETPAPPGSLFETLIREIGAGGPVAIAPAKEGAIAVSLDGSRKRTLVPAPVNWVFVDNRSLVLWFQRGAGARSELWLLDLTLANPSPEVALKGLPADEVIALGHANPGRAIDVVKPGYCEYDGCTQVLLHPTRPSTQFIQGRYDAIFEDQGFAHERIVAKVQIVAAPRLRELALRGKDAALLLPITSSSGHDSIAAVPVSEAHCEDPDQCGTTEPLPGTDLLRVIVQHDCGDACHVLWQMYDPKSKQFIDFKTGRRSAKPIYGGKPGNMSDAFFSRDGAGFIVRGDVYRIDGRKVSTGQGRGGGWLGGQRHVGL